MNGDRVTRTHLLGIVSGLLRAGDLFVIFATLLANISIGDAWAYSGTVGLEVLAAVILEAVGFSRTGAYSPDVISRLTLRFAASPPFGY